MMWHEASWRIKLGVITGLIGCLVWLSYGEPDFLLDMAITSAMGACDARHNTVLAMRPRLQVRASAEDHLRSRAIS